MHPRFYLTLTVVIVGILTLTGLSTACPEATGWYRSPVTNLCYRGLNMESLSYAEAQKRCNELRSNLFQFNSGDTKKTFDDLQNDLYYFYNTTEFKTESWIGLTDRAAAGVYVYLNNFALKSIAPDTLISCPDTVPNCKPAYRCVSLNLFRRGSSNKQVFNRHCENDKLPAICYAPIGGTDKFDTIPALGAQSVSGGSLAALLLVSCLSAALKLMVR